MSKAVMLSIQPKWCELIAIGKKTIEVRKTRPSIETPFKVYIYQTKKKWIYRLLEKLGLYQRKIIGEFVCDAIYKIEPHNDGYGVNQYICGWTYNWKHGICDDCLSFEEMHTYLNGQIGYGWHISDLVIYDQPRELGEFERQCFENLYEGIGSKICHKCDQYLRTTMYEPCDCKNDGYKPLTRPPQSWCYVEEV